MKLEMPRLTVGPVLCDECQNVAEQGKNRCARHLELARQTAERFTRKRGVKPWHPGGLATSKNACG
jgi:hypothetical protein